MQPDWLQWHREYADPHTHLAMRLQLVQRRISEALSSVRSPEPRIVSMCSGQAHDLIGALRLRRHAAVRARLVEVDPRSVALASLAAEKLGLTGLEFVCGDASMTDAYAGAVPADVVICCGVFGNMSIDQVERTISFLPQLCSQSALVIWTRHRRPPDETRAIRKLFAQNGFSESSFDETERFGIGVEQLVALPQPLQLGERIFQFGAGLWQ